MITPDREFRPLTTHEKAILEKLLSTDFRGRDELLQQLVGLQAMQLDIAGSLRFRVSGGGSALISRGVAVEAKYPDLDTKSEVGPHVNVLLHVTDGKLSMLEIYKDDGSRILSLPKPSEFKVFSQYCT